MDSAPLLLTLYSAPECCLCEQLQAQISTLAAEFPLRLEVVEITGNAELERRFRPEIPVLFINGRKAVKHRITTPALRQKLERALGRRTGLLRLFR